MTIFVPRNWLVLAAGCMIWLSVGCGGSEFSPPLPIVRIILGIGDCAGLRVGETCSLEVTAIDSDGAVVTDPSLRWSSTNPFVASVDFLGNVTGFDAGNTTIRVETEDAVVMEQTTITVTEQPPPGPDPEGL